MPRPRLHRSSVVVGLILAILLVLTMIPGRVVHGRPSTWMTFEHGLPFNYLRREAEGRGPEVPFIMYRGRQEDVAERPMLGIPWLALDNWRLWEAPTDPEIVGFETPHWEFNGRMLAADIAAAILVLDGVIAAWEFRLRRRPGVLSFSLADMLVTGAAISTILGWGVYLEREYQREYALFDKVDNESKRPWPPWSGDDEACIAPVWLRSLVGERLLSEFTWRTTSVVVVADDVENSETLAAQLSELTYLDKVAIDNIEDAPSFRLVGLCKLKRIATLEFDGGFCSNEDQVEELKQLRQLRKIVLSDKEDIHPATIAELEAALPNCRVVDCVDCIDDW